MISWFDSIWNWFCDNRESIVTFVTSSDFALGIATMFTLVKTILSTNKNTSSLDLTTKAVKENTVIKDNVLDINNKTNNMSVNINEINSKIAKIEESNKQFNEEVLFKINSVLDVQSIVYSTIKDDDLRNSVNHILINAKHSDSISKAKLHEEIKNLKVAVEQKNKDLDEAVNEIVNKVSNDVDNVNNVNSVKSSSKLTRY